MKIGIINKKDLLNLNSIFLAIIICSNFISNVINKLTGKNNIIMLIIGITFISSFIINSIYTLKKEKFKKMYLLLFFVVFLLFIFFISYINKNNYYLRLYFISFLGYGVISIYVASREFLIEKLFKYINFIYIFNFWLFLVVDINTLDPGSKMGLGYILTIPVCTLFYSIFNNKDGTIKKVTYTVFLLYFIYFLLEIASRGAILTILIFILLSIYIKRNRKSTAILVVFSTIILVVIMLSNIINILTYINDLLMKFNIESSFIKHTINTINTDNVMNGRELLFSDSIQRIKQSWLWGNGIGDFTNKNMGQYVHNMFLQIMDEGGIILFIPLVSILIIGLKKIIMDVKQRINIEDKILIAFLFSISIPKLSLSSVYWVEQNFWILLTIIYIKFIYGRIDN